MPACRPTVALFRNAKTQTNSVWNPQMSGGERGANEENIMKLNLHIFSYDDDVMDR
jgi:hypothetical protein